MTAVRSGGGRTPRRRVDGVLLLDKPVGLTSNAALQRVKRLYAAEKAGHTGTLDPLASGLLPICFGEATKFAQRLLDADKRYRATVRFGVVTTTGDAEGELVVARPCDLSESAIAQAFGPLTGRIQQIPPAYSALKLRGRSYHAYARAGIDVERAPRPVDIHTLLLVEWSPPDAVIDVDCGKGTYVRVLAEDLGNALGCGAHLAGLRRIRAGPFDLSEATPLEELEAMNEGARDARLLATDTPLAAINRLDLDAATLRALFEGRQPELALVPGCYRAFAPNGSFAGLVEARADRLRAIRLVRHSSGTD